MRLLDRIGGMDAGDRLRRAVDSESRIFDEPPPTDVQIAMVLHALADHTSLMQALGFDPPDDGMWPEATSLGRWFHAYGDVMRERAMREHHHPELWPYFRDGPT